MKSIKEIEENIKNICQQYQYTFLHFCDKNGQLTNWNNVSKSYVKIKCNNCLKENIVSYRHFAYKEFKCECKYKRTKERIQNILNKIEEECKRQNVQFNGFVKGKYQSYKTWLDLTCLKCGYNWTTTNVGNFVTLKHGCHNCNGGVKKSMEEIIENINSKAKELNCTFIDFVNGYQNEYSLLKLQCNKCKEIWTTTNYNNFLNGQGCPKCNIPILEKEIETLLTEKEISFEYQKKFSWLGRQSLDFYLPKYNIAIECQGEQHFKPIEYFGGEEKFKVIQKRDFIKRELCEKYHIKLLYYSNLNIIYPYQVYTSKNDLIQKILEEKKLISSRIINIYVLHNFFSILHLSSTKIHYLQS